MISFRQVKRFFETTALEKEPRVEIIKLTVLNKMFRVEIPALWIIEHINIYISLAFSFPLFSSTVLFSFTGYLSAIASFPPH